VITDSIWLNEQMMIASLGNEIYFLIDFLIDTAQ